MIDMPLSPPLTRLDRPRPRLFRVHWPQIRWPTRAVLVVWTCMPLFAAQLMLLSILLAQ